ncbi:hypothetical protein [Streptomyces sp. NPDC005046]
MTRLLELAGNGNGDGDRTLSLFTPPVHPPRRVRRTAAHRTSADSPDLSAAGLASLYRELAYKAPGLAEGMRAGVQEEWAGGPGGRDAELPGITA